MNAKTAKLLRQVARVRGNTRPTYIRYLKRQWYKLSEEERELKRIEYQTEIDEYERDIRGEYEVKIQKEKIAVVEKEKALSNTEEEIMELRSRYESIKSQIQEMGFIGRLKYMITGNLTFNEDLKWTTQDL